MMRKKANFEAVCKITLFGFIRFLLSCRLQTNHTIYTDSRNSQYSNFKQRIKTTVINKYDVNNIPSTCFIQHSIFIKLRYRNDSLFRLRRQGKKCHRYSDTDSNNKVT